MDTPQLSDATSATAESLEQELWTSWGRERNSANRSALFFFYAEWVRVVASWVCSRYPHAMAEWQDYMQFASVGALKAIDRFEPAIQPQFKAFAEPYIKGEILRGLACFARDSKRRPEAGIGRVVPDRAEEPDLYSLEEIVDVAVGLAFGHFLELGIPDKAPLDNNPLSIYESDRQLGMLADYVERLPERERQVVVAHYFQHLPFTEVAQLLDVSKPRITQLHQKALSRIRAWYEEDSELPDSLL